jgi:hypothetical protein
LYVANTPAGPGAVAALRFESDDPSPGTLTLTVNERSSQFASVALIQACSVQTNWKYEENGPWKDVPLYTCVGVRPVLASDGVTMSWQIPESFQDPLADHVDVLLAPEPGSNTPFQLAFDPPNGLAFSQPGATATVPEPEPDPFFAPAPDASGAFLPAEPVPAYSFVDNVQALPVIVTTPARSGRPRQNIPLARTTPAVSFHDTDRRQRIEATLALFAIAAAWFWLAGEPARAPRLLGTVGGGSRRVSPATAEPVRGIGRFSRPRTGRAPKLG